MFTATTKQIISPIADVVSQLIVRNAEAEQNNSAMEDISEYASVVVAQIQNFSNVVMDIIGSQGSDEVLKKEMNDGNLIVKKAAEDMLSSAKHLKDDPCSKEGRRLLVDATRGILDGVTTLLNSYDDYNVRKIVQLCNDLISCYEQCRDNTDPQKIIDNIKLCSRYSVKLASLATQRIAEFLSANLKKELQSAIDLLTKTSPLLISSCKSYLQNQQKKVNADGFHDVCETLIHATNEIKRIVQIAEVSDDSSVKIGELADLVSGMENDEKEMIACIKNKDVDGFNAAQAAYNKKSDQFIKEASDVADKIEDDDEKNKLQDLIDSVRTSSNSVDVMVSKCALQKFSDDRANADLVNQIKYNTACCKYINGELNRQLMSSMAKTCEDISNKDDESTSFGNAYKKALAGEGQLKQEDIDRLSKSIDKLNDDYQTMNDKVSSEHDAAVNETIEKNKENVEKMKPVLLNALQAAAENPDEPNHKKHLENVAGVWTDQVQALKNSLIVEPGLFTTPELLNNTMGTFLKCMKKLEEEGDKLSDEEAEALRKEALASAKQFLEVAKYEMNNTEDEAYRMELLKQIQDVEKILPILSQPYTASNKTDLLSAARKIGSLLGSLNGLMKTKLPASNAVLEPPPPPQKQIVINQVDTPQEVQENVVSTPTQATIIEPEEEEEEEEPEVEPLQEDEAKEFPIKAAGRDLKLEAAQWSGSKNDIIAKVNIVAQKMEELSLIHSNLATNPIAKKEMIQKALEITQVTNSILKDCRELAELCTDKRLKMQLLNTVDRLNTLSQQLRVVTAVKASNPRDLDTDNQLFSCASNLTETMKRLLRDSEAASVRCNFKTSGTAALAIIKFKKNLKKGKVGAAFKKAAVSAKNKSVGATLQQ